MTAHNLKRYMMPLFAFFIMFAGARAAETVTDCLWVKEYPYGTKFSNVQFSKTDKFIVALESGNFIFLNAETGQEIGRIQNRLHISSSLDYHWGKIEFINSDNEFYIQSLDRKTIECYSTKDFTKLYDLGKVDSMIYEFSVSPDEKYLVASIGDKVLKLWDLNSKSIIASYTQPTYQNDVDGRVRYPVFNLDSKSIIANYYRKMHSPNSDLVMIRNIQYNLQLDSTRIFDFQNRYVWSKSGKYAAVIYQEATGGNHICDVTIYEIATMEQINKFSIPYAAIPSYFFSKDEQYLIVAYAMSENICRVFRISDGVNTINYQTGSANGAALSNSGDDLAFVTANVTFKYRFSSTSSVHSSINHEFSINPNPVVDSASLSFNLTNGGVANISISDAQGVIVKQISTEYLASGTQVLQLPLNDLANGVYYITVANDTQKFTDKIIVNK